MKNHKQDAGHMTKMAAMLIYNITLKNLLSMNQWAEFDSTWFDALETQAYYTLFK